jgi:hypothetical protein
MKNQIFKKIFILGFLLLGSYVQSQSVSGTVSDLYGSPLPGVTVIIKNTAKGVTTDFDGRFDVPEVTIGETLVFS